MQIITFNEEAKTHNERMEQSLPKFAFGLFRLVSAEWFRKSFFGSKCRSLDTVGCATTESLSCPNCSIIIRISKFVLLIVNFGAVTHKIREDSKTPFRQSE